jgi:hypothetical protein
MPALFLDQSYSSLSYGLPDRPDFEADEPDRIEAHAAAGRASIAAGSGCAPLIKMLSSPIPAVLCASADALFNLAILRDNADELHALDTLRKLHDMLRHDDDAVVNGFAGVLMNCCASSPAAREELAGQGLLSTLLSLLARGAGDVDGPLVQPELVSRVLGALNNLLLDSQCAASAIQHEAGVLLLLRLLREPQTEDEALLEDAASCLVHIARADAAAVALLIENGALGAVEARLPTELEELQLRLCQLAQRLCAAQRSAREQLHALGGTLKVLPLLYSSAEEVQEGAALALQELTNFKPAAVLARRQGGIDGLVALFRSSDPSVRTAAVACLVNICRVDPKAAAAVRESEGIPPLVAFLDYAGEAMRVAAAFCIESVARNESNKTLLREAEAIDGLLRMLSHTCSEEEHVAAAGACVQLLINEEDAATVFRLQAGIQRLRPILAMDDALRPALAAEVLSHCASSNSESRVAMRVHDVLRPLVALLSSPTRRARLGAASALMNATNSEPTNQIKVRELGGVVPLMSLLEEEAAAPNGGERAMQVCAAWCLANIAGDSRAAAQLGLGRTGHAPLLALLDGPNVSLQRPAAACLLNASINDAATPANLLRQGALHTLVGCLRYASEDANTDVVAWAAGALLNMAHAGSEGLQYDLVVAEAPADASRLLSALLDCIGMERDANPLQNAHAAGALGNLAAHSPAAGEALVARGAVKLLLDVLGGARDEPTVAGFAAGALASLLHLETGRQALVEARGVSTLTEALDSEDSSVTAAAAVALLNAMAHEPSREALVDAGGVDALLSCVASRDARVREAAAGALLNASATVSVAEAVRDGTATVERGGKTSMVPALPFLRERMVHIEAGAVLRARVAGVFFNCAAYGPDNRLALLEAGVLMSAVNLLHDLTSPSVDAKGVPVWVRAMGPDATAAQRWRLVANVIGIVLNCALNPTTKEEVLRGDGLTPLLAATESGDAVVMALAATAVAYVSDRAEMRPGSPSSPARAADAPPRNTFRKRHFHTGTAGAAEDLGPPDDEADDGPGARPTAIFGRMPEIKLSATHDSGSKGPRFVAEPVETCSRRTEAVAIAAALSCGYTEIPSPLPSPRDDE